MHASPGLVASRFFAPCARLWLLLVAGAACDGGGLHAPAPSAGAVHGRRPTGGPWSGARLGDAGLARAALPVPIRCAEKDDPHAGHTPPPRPAESPGSTAADPIARGEYLVRHVSLCVECHSPRLPSGAFDEARLLSGVRDAFDLDPDDAARGALHAPNLTPDDATGLGRWTDDEIENAFQHGMGRDGRVLHWTMPYWAYHAMTDADAGAVVAYLRSLPAVEHRLPERQPLPVELEQPYHLPPDAIPQSAVDPFLPEFAQAERGRYLATAAGLCLYCHTPPPDDDPTLPLDLERVFAGRRRFAPVRLATALDAPAPLIETRNLTPHATGLLEWSARDIANALRFGVSANGLPVCDPMPSTFGGSLLGMQEQDALDIGVYLKTIPPQDSGEIRACCAACHGARDEDAGAP